MNLRKIRTYEESIFNPLLNIKRINENIISNEMPIDKFIIKSQNIYEMKKKNETIVNLTGEDESGIEDEIIKSDEEKIINDNNNIASPKVIKQALIDTNDKQIKTINVQNIKKRSDLKFDKINKILEQEEKDNIIEKALYYQNISFNSKLINFFNNELKLLLYKYNHYYNKRIKLLILYITTLFIIIFTYMNNNLNKNNIYIYNKNILNNIKRYFSL